MSVNDTSKSPMANAFAQAVPDVQPAGQQQQQPRQPQAQTQYVPPAQPVYEAQRPGTFSFRKLGNLSQQPMSRSPAAEVLTNLYKALTELYEKSADKTMKIELIPIDFNSTVELNVSVLVVTVQNAQCPQWGVGYHVLIIEGSIEPQAPRIEQIMNVTVEILRTVADANDPTMRNYIRNLLQRKFPNKPLHYADACVVPRDFNVADATIVHSLAANALFACHTEMEVSQKDFIDMNLANAEQDSGLTVRTTFGNAQITNALGQPVRSDIKIDFAAGPLNNQITPVTGGMDRVSSIARISGFMDLVWYPVENVANPYQQQQSVLTTQRYAARFVITALESSQLLTIPAQLLALIPSLSLSEGNKWINAFRNKNFGSEVDMHDIGAVNMEVNLDNNPSGVGTRVNTKLASFTPEQLSMLVKASIRPGMILSLDIPESGPDTNYNGVFGAAAGGNTNAEQDIIRAAVTLTNGEFNRHWQNGMRVFTSDVNRVHMGYYTDHTGVRKDIRDIDHLAVLNLIGEKDPTIIKDWSDTNVKDTWPSEMRLAGRKKIITALFSDVTITGFATRVTFSPEFRNALLQGARSAGLALRSIDPYTDMSNYERAVSSTAAASLISADASGMFNSFGNRQQAGYGNMGGNFVDRWQR